jgi:hypothetical protein
VVPVILDGENAWEHYPENGAAFLSRLYSQLAETPELRTVTFSEFLDLEPSREELKSIKAGSWIYGNLATWIGHPEKNRAWEFLAAARRCLNSFQGQAGDRRQLEKASHEMMIAEGSDWFWWYGDDHSTQNAVEFDTLFRSHVKNVYRLLGQPHPVELDTPIKRVALKAQYRDPLRTISPRLDGKITDYYEWLAAGYAVPGGGESMHRSQRCLEKIFFGYDRERFYLRLDLTSSGQGDMMPTERSLRVHFAAPREFLLSLTADQGGRWRCSIVRSSVPDLATEFAGYRILELGILLGDLGVKRGEEVRFAVSALEGDQELERFPVTGFLSVPVDPWELDERDWIV